jgi:hypothetical protein
MKPYLFGDKGIMAEAQRLYSQGMDLPDYRVAGLAPEHQQAAGLAHAGIGGYLPALTSASNAMGSGITAATGALNLVPGTLANAQPYQTGSAATGLGATQGYNPSAYQDFMNPYLEDVVRKAEGDIARQGETQAQGLRSQAVGSGAFGGSRQGVEQRELGRNIAEQQAKTSSSLRAAGYQSAQDMAQKAFEAQQLRQADYAKLLGNLGTSYGQLGLQGAQTAGGLASTLGNLGTGMGGLAELGQSLNIRDIGTLMDVGSMYQTQTQAELDAARQNQYQEVMSPWQTLGQYAGIVQGMPMMAMGTQSSTQPGPSAASQIAGLGIAGLGLGKSGFWG